MIFVCSQFMSSVLPAEHDSRFRSSISSSSCPLFSYTDVHSLMSTHSTKFVSHRSVCYRVMAVSRYALYVGSDILTRLHNAVSFLRKIIKTKGLSSW